MGPDLLAKGLVVEFADATGHVLGGDIECNLGLEQVGADADRRRDAGARQDLVAQHACEAFRIGVIEVQIGCHVDKALIDGVDVHVLGADVFQIDTVDLR